MRDPNSPCLFCNTDKEEYIFENDLAYATFDSYPVSKFHVLIINPKLSILFDQILYTYYSNFSS